MASQRREGPLSIARRRARDLAFDAWVLESSWSQFERVPGGAVVFRHADGSLYGDPSSPRRVDAHAKVFSALRHLGFRESDVKAVLAELRADVALAEATVERVLREALCRIQPRAR